MNSEVRMSVSAMTRKDGNKGVYVLFTDREKTAEFVLPGCKIIRNQGFSEDELQQLSAYVDGEQDAIYAMAKTVNPLKALMED